jgi:hypothetical protein
MSSHLLSESVKNKINTIIILPGVLYGCETWSPIFKQEYTQRVFEHRLVRKIYGPGVEEIKGI